MNDILVYLSSTYLDDYISLGFPLFVHTLVDMLQSLAEQSPSENDPPFSWKPFAGRKQVPSTNGTSPEFEPTSPRVCFKPTIARQASSSFTSPALSPTATCALTPEALGEAVMMQNFPVIIEPLSLDEEHADPQSPTERFTTSSSSSSLYNKLPSLEDALTNASNLCPVFPRQGPSFRPDGILAMSAATSLSPLDEGLQSTLDLATSLLAETLDFDFVYLMSIEISDPLHSIQSHSTHNPPIPMPYFDPHLHLQALQTPPSILVFKNPGYMTVPPGAYGAGLLVKVALSGSRGFILGGFSEGTKNTPIQRDLRCFKSFAATMEKYVPRL